MKRCGIRERRDERSVGLRWEWGPFDDGGTKEKGADA